MILRKFGPHDLAGEFCGPVVSLIGVHGCNGEAQRKVRQYLGLRQVQIDTGKDGLILEHKVCCFLVYRR